MFCLRILTGLVAVLLNKDVKPDAVLVVTAALYLFVVFGISFMLARQIPKLIDVKLKAWDRGPDQSYPANLPRTTAQLDDHREPAMSVTDHTTRMLEKVPAIDG